ncbi:MAG TPA: helix-turn-helix domain-containing protein, partial [Candidatus Saccharimonadales bacterium]|nr:helix-turn-helix domain-containing protein [Candidatus Saccharimonadales bacterium]
MLFTEAKKEKIVLSAVEKEKIVLSVLEDAIPVSEVSKKYSVARKTVYAWIKRYKKGNLAPLYIKGKKHPAAIYPKAYSYINRWIVAHPGWGCRTMSAKLKEKGINLSHVQVNKLLNRIGAENFDRRINYARNFAGPGRSSEDVRLEVVKKAVDGRISIYSLSEEYKVARKTIYKWIKKYESAGKIKDSYVTGASHPRAIYPKITQQVLNLVVSNPEYSVHTLAKFVPASSWTIWSILNRNNLNIYGLRLEYSRRASEAAVQKVPAGGIFGRIRSVFESFTPNLAPAPPPKFSSILKTFGI